MKTNIDDTHGGYLCGVAGTHCESGSWKQAFANYLVQYIRFYQLSGIKITELGFLNKPQENVYNASMLSDATQAADFTKVLAPTIKAAGLDVKLTCCDGVGWNEQAEMLAGLQASGAENLLSLITSHGYSSPPVPLLPLIYRFGRLSRPISMATGQMTGTTLAWKGRVSSGPPEFKTPLPRATSAHFCIDRERRQKLQIQP